MRIIRTILFLFLTSTILFSAPPDDLDQKMNKHMKKLPPEDFNNSIENKQSSKLKVPTNKKLEDKLLETDLNKNTSRDLNKISLKDINEEIDSHINQKQGLESSKRKNKKGYIEIKKAGVYFHINVPYTYDPEKKMPLLIALHRESGTGEEFLPQLQLNNNKDIMIICPDSIDHWTWSKVGSKRRQNIKVIENALIYMRKNYNVDAEKIFLLGHGAGGVFLLSMLSDEVADKNSSKDILAMMNALIISGADARVEMENDIWELPITYEDDNEFKNDKKSSFKSINKFGLVSVEDFPKPDIFMLASRSDFSLPVSSIRWTKDFLREHSYRVNYYEGEWDGYPIGYNNDIFEWCLKDDKDFSDKVIVTEKNKIGVTNQFVIHQILQIKQSTQKKDIVKYKAAANDNHFSSYNSPYFMEYKKNTGSTWSAPRLTLINNKYTSSFSYNRELMDTDFKEKFKDVRVVFMAFNENKEQVAVNEWRFAGFDPGDKNIRDYKKQKYGLMISKTDRQIEEENSIKTAETINLECYTPYKANDEYACFIVYKGGRVAAIRMYPENTDHTQFPDLEHIVLKNTY